MKTYANYNTSLAVYEVVTRNATENERPKK
jgi:hypothetical protein